MMDKRPERRFQFTLAHALVLVCTIGLLLSVILHALLQWSKINIADVARHHPFLRQNGFELIIGHLPVPNGTGDSIVRRSLQYLRAHPHGAISIKLYYFKDADGRVRQRALASFLRDAQANGTFVWMDAMTRRDNREEIDTYTALCERYSNFGVTIQCYHTTADAYVDEVLARGGHVRLVKGFYNDGEIDWERTTQSYRRNARKLLHDGWFHQLATHDFNILGDLFREFGSLDTVEVAFFWFSRRHVLPSLRSFPFVIKRKAFYIPIGSPFTPTQLRHTHVRRTTAWLSNAFL